MIVPKCTFSGTHELFVAVYLSLNKVIFVHPLNIPDKTRQNVLLLQGIISSSPIPSTPHNI